MVSATMRLALARLEAVLAQEAADPLSVWRPTPVQREVLADPARFRLFRGPNQGAGKTETGAIDLVGRLTGRHPYMKVRKPPIRAWVVMVTKDQSVVVQEKIYEKLPHDEVDWERTSWGKAGFTGGRLIMKNGSRATMITCGQETAALASATLDHMWIDEPPWEAHWGELMARLLSRRGSLLMTLTPINRPVAWIRAMTEAQDGHAPILSEHHCTLELEHCHPEGWALPYLAQHDIDTITRIYPVEQHPQRLRGEWEGYASDRRFTAYSPSVLLTVDQFKALELELDVRDLVLFGLDHGEGTGRQYVTLILRISDVYYQVAEWLGDTDEGEAAIARAMLDMLRQFGLSYYRVDKATGDINTAGLAGSGGRYNQFIDRAIVDALNAENPDRPPISRSPNPIDTPSKGRGSVAAGEMAMNTHMREGTWRVLETCAESIKAFQYYQANGKRGEEELKDRIDGARYAVAHEILTLRRGEYVLSRR